MIDAITNNIKVSVETAYQPAYSYPTSHHFMFSYRIKITNKSNNAVQLLRRHWHIIDGFGYKREVEGEGVIGEQPIIQPNSSFEYVSACDLKTNIGKMFGSYLMLNSNNGNLFDITIPQFFLVAPEKLN